MMMKNSNRTQWVKTFINETQQSIFLTGKAGTGKTTLLKEIVRDTHKLTVITAPTGIAALQAGGVTLHSLFQLPFTAYSPGSALTVKTKGLTSDQISIIKNMELLIIDEVSMLRADILDALDMRIRKVRRKEEPFGGIQVLFVGDLMQLPPVVKKEDWAVLKQHYKGLTFFHAKAIEQSPPLCIELMEVYRQADSYFVQLLNQLRSNRISMEDLAALNARVDKNFDIEQNPGYMYLATHKYQVEEVNRKYMEGLGGPSKEYKAIVEKDFPPKLYPTDFILSLKIGAQVMFIRNDSNAEKRFFNGKMGRIVCLEEEFLGIELENSGDYLEIGIHKWEHVVYEMDKQNWGISPKVLGTFYQFPVKIARAITIHKSQGSTFEKAYLDLKYLFQPGQAYVAFSRLRSLEGLVLKHKLTSLSFPMQKEIDQWNELQMEDKLLQDQLVKCQRENLRRQILQSLEVDSLIYSWQKHYRKEVKFESGGFPTLVYEHIKSLSSFKKELQLYRAQILAMLRTSSEDYFFLGKSYRLASQDYFRLLRKIYYEWHLMLQCMKTLDWDSAYCQQVKEREEELFRRMQTISKTKKLLWLKERGLEYSKEAIRSSFACSYYEIYSTRAERQMMRYQKQMTVDRIAEKVFHNFRVPVKSSNTLKKPTEEITLRLLKQGKDIDEIAHMRGLRKKTIIMHLQNLIQNRKINLEHYMGESSMEFLDYLFREHYRPSTGIAHLKSLTQGDFTTEELTLFKAHWLLE